MKIIKIETGKYQTEDTKFLIEKDYTSANGGMKIVPCWIIKKSGCQVRTCKTIGEAKEYVNIYYA